MINLSKLKQSEQVLLAIVITIIVLGIYGFLRFMPQYQYIQNLELEAESTQQKLLTAQIPLEPEQDVSVLSAKLDDHEQAIELLKEMADKVQQQLAPVDSQELKVLISQLARDLKIRIISNNRVVTQAPVPVISGNKKNNKKTKEDNKLILPESASWLDRMATNTIFYRPVQRIEIIGEYKAIRAFINELDNLPWQVTVIKISIKKQPLTPLRGYAQSLKAELYLAL